MLVRTFVKSSSVLASPTLLVFLVACAGKDGARSTSHLPSQSSSEVGVQAQSIAKQDYSGEELFQGLCLLSGPLADKIPTLRDNYKLEILIPDSNQRNKIGELFGGIIKVIKNNDSNFFPWFKGEIESGDQLRIQAALVRASELTSKAMASMVDFAQCQNEFNRIDRDPVLREKVSNLLENQGVSYQELQQAISLLVANGGSMASLQALGGNQVFQNLMPNTGTPAERLQKIIMAFTAVEKQIGTPNGSTATPMAACLMIWIVVFYVGAVLAAVVGGVWLWYQVWTWIDGASTGSATMTLQRETMINEIANTFAKSNP